MADGDKKVSQLQSHTTPASEDLFLIIDNPNGTPVGKSITHKILFGNVTSNTHLHQTLKVDGDTTLSSNTTVRTLTVANNGLVIAQQYTPASSSDAAPATGKLFFDANYLYIKVSNTVIKRVALSTF